MGEKISLQFIIGIILSLIVIIFVFFPFAKGIFGFLWGVFFRAEDEATFNNFQVLSNNIQRVLAEKSISVPYYIKSGSYILVGFNKDCDLGTKNRNCPQSGCSSGDKKYYIPKPIGVAGCSLNKACLCLFRDTFGADFEGEDNLPLICNSFSHIDYFGVRDGEGELFSGRNKRTFLNQEYKSFVLYGKCGGYEWGARDIQITHVTVDDKSLVLFGINQ